MLVVDIARVVFDPEALDDTELETGADVDVVADGTDDELEAANEEVDIDELLDDPDGDANADNATAEDDVEDAVPDEELVDEVGIAVVDPEEKVVAVVTSEEFPCATAAGFS